ncbi:hypothetical protein KGV55_02770 [Candidatus Gracilibacteria bacterium]|nr:hypothetical protein [Candidatus Gracilibacteria bacterium]
MKHQHSHLDKIWIDKENPDVKYIEKIFKKYDFHELDREAILEENQQTRLDPYDDYLFIVLYFPKFDKKTQRYLANELNIFISKEYLITFRYYRSYTLQKVQNKYIQRDKENKTISPAFILYDIIENFLDKTTKMLKFFSMDIKKLEKQVFSTRNTKTIHEIMIKKRNIITLKHMMQPQISVLKLIEFHMKRRFSNEVELYFENLEDKLDKIFLEIQIIEENLDSLEDALKSIFDLETNITMKYLTIFSAFMLPLTLATSFFGMNTKNGHFSDVAIWGTLIFVSIFCLGLLIIYLRKKH